MASSSYLRLARQHEENHRGRMKVVAWWKRTLVYWFSPDVRALVELVESMESLLESRWELVAAKQKQIEALQRRG